MKNIGTSSRSDILKLVSFLDPLYQELRNTLCTTHDIIYFLKNSQLIHLISPNSSRISWIRKYCNDDLLSWIAQITNAGTTPWIHLFECVIFMIVIERPVENIHSSIVPSSFYMGKQAGVIDYGMDVLYNVTVKKLGRNDREKWSEHKRISNSAKNFTVSLMSIEQIMIPNRIIKKNEVPTRIPWGTRKKWDLQINIYIQRKKKKEQPPPVINASSPWTIIFITQQYFWKQIKHSEKMLRAPLALHRTLNIPFINSLAACIFLLLLYLFSVNVIVKRAEHYQLDYISIYTYVYFMDQYSVYL